MRRAALLLSLLALSSLAFAPAPLPKRDRETPAQKSEREVNALARRLRELGVRWRVTNDQDGAAVQFTVEVRRPDRNGSMIGECPLAGESLPRALRYVLRQAEAFIRGDELLR